VCYGGVKVVWLKDNGVLKVDRLLDYIFVSYSMFRPGTQCSASETMNGYSIKKETGKRQGNSFVKE